MSPKGKMPVVGNGNGEALEDVSGQGSGLWYLGPCNDGLGKGEEYCKS